MLSSQMCGDRNSVTIGGGITVRRVVWHREVLAVGNCYYNGFVYLLLVSIGIVPLSEVTWVM